MLGHEDDCSDQTCAQVGRDLHDMQQFTKATVGEVQDQLIVYQRTTTDWNQVIFFKADKGQHVSP